MTQQRLARIAATLVLTLLVPLAIAEAAVRMCGHYDRNADFWLHDIMVPPHHVRRIERDLARYAERGDSYLRYDADLGWSVRPNAVAQDQAAHANSQGLRALRTYAADPPPGVLRVALFGDSYVHGNDVGDKDCVASYLEQELNARGRAAEVLNFGVSGYGMDQALLRYRRDGVPFHPDVVVFGLQVENMRRNVNIFRCFLSPWNDEPFSKPRFTLEGGALRLVNSPTIPPEAILHTIDTFSSSPLAPYETFYRERDWHVHLYHHSRLLSVLDYLLFPLPDPQKPAGPAMDVTLGIVQAFASDVQQSGAAFVVPYIPMASVMNEMQRGRDPDAAVLARIGSVQPILMPADLLATARAEGAAHLCMWGKRHYSPQGNKLLAHAIADAVIGEPLRH